MDLQPKKSLSDLEKIYGLNKNLGHKPDLEFGELKIAKEEYKAKMEEAYKQQQEIELAANFATETLPNGSKKSDLIEIKTFLPTFADKMISNRYENPLKDLRISTKRWKTFTFILAISSFVYFSLHLWATLTLLNVEVLSKSPRAILQVSSMLLEMQDMLYYNYKVNIILDSWALVIYLCLMIKLLRESSTKIDSEEEVNGRLRKIMRTIIFVAAVLFGLSYISGTVLVFMAKETHNLNVAMATLIAFHVIKVIFLLLNVVALRKYKSKKFIYEDLLLEALGPSDSGDDKSEDDNRENFENNFLP